jgi:hypothetical protein
MELPSQSMEQPQAPDMRPTTMEIIEVAEQDSPGIVRVTVGADGYGEPGYDHAKAEERARAALQRVLDDEYET